jgi:hypothetical protein
MAQEDDDKMHPSVRRFKKAIADFLRYAADTMTLIELTTRGARTIVGYRGIHRRIQDLEGADPNRWTVEDAARLESAERSASMAETEIARGFPLLHNHALMGLWGALEAMVDDVSANWLEAHPQYIASDHFPKIQVELGQFFALNAFEQKRHVVEEIKRKQGAVLRTGAGQFEGLLDAIGLGGPLDPDVRNVLRIAKSLRNVVAHRGGKVDARVIGDCPDLGLQLGRPIRISQKQMEAIIFAMWMYAEEINRRRRAASSIPPVEPHLPPGMLALSELSEPFKAQIEDASEQPPASGPAVS